MKTKTIMLMTAGLLIGGIFDAVAEDGIYQLLMRNDAQIKRIYRDSAVKMKADGTPIKAKSEDRLKEELKEAVSDIEKTKADSDTLSTEDKQKSAMSENEYFDDADDKDKRNDDCIRFCGEGYFYDRPGDGKEGKERVCTKYQYDCGYECTTEWNIMPFVNDTIYTCQEAIQAPVEIDYDEELKAVKNLGYTVSSANVSSKVEEETIKEIVSQPETPVVSTQPETPTVVSQKAEMPYAGPSDAAVVVEEFFDFNCGHCKQMMPVMINLIHRYPNIKFQFKPVNFLNSDTAARAALVAHQEGRFLEVYAALMNFQGVLDNNALRFIFNQAGLDAEKCLNLMNSDEITMLRFAVDSEVATKGIKGVPSLFVNGQPINAYTESGIEQAIRSF